MELREYVSVRRAYGVVRQDIDSDSRLTFEEYAILCKLMVDGLPMRTSDIAEYQGALRPTMTHRTNHLAALGLIERAEGSEDRRNVVCTISDQGRDRVRELSELTCGRITGNQPLSRTSADRLVNYVAAMGQVFCRAGELVLLAVYESEADALSISDLVDALGLLQPTVSMSVASLVNDGLVTRDPRTPAGSVRTATVGLTPAGEDEARKVAARIQGVIVRRKPRVTF